MKRILLIAVFIHFFLFSDCQKESLIRVNFQSCLDSLKQLLIDNGSFKRAVFLTENCFLDNQMHYDRFDSVIGKLVHLLHLRELANPVKYYHFSDSLDLEKNYALFSVLKDTTKFILPDKKIYYFLPYQYDFHDFFGRENWCNMFVTKLLSTHSGNCHSLPYLYKILADEIGASCWLSLAPNHIYIQNRCKMSGWYNTELTSGQFPIDAWIMASGYLPLKAIQSGIYMDTLSNQESIALCILDLAKGYEHKVHNYSDGFILSCCETSLRYYPKNIQAFLLKAETLRHLYLKSKAEGTSQSPTLLSDMQDLYLKIFDMGYREMPDKMYIDWLQSVVKEKEKYSKKILYCR